jgi:dTDP-4-amino-4,6-dideoxygalactose transaminase
LANRELPNGGVQIDPITWGNFPLPLIQVNPPSINLTTEIVNSAYKSGVFSNSGALHEQASELLSGHVNPEFAGYLACSNTSGLVACLLEINVRNRHVLVSNFTFAATLNSIILAGGIPVLCDINSEELVMTESNVLEILEIKDLDIAAVIPTRVFGFVTDFSELVDTCAKRGIPVVVDAAATFPDRKNVWNFKHHAKFEVFSLHATKVFGIGEGGLIVGSPEAIKSVKERANFGFRSVDPIHFQDGLNAKADEFTAARALARFSEYANDVEIRRTFISRYRSVFESSRHVKLINDGSETIYSYFPVIFDDEVNLTKFVEFVSPYIKTRRYYFPSLNNGYIGNARIEKPVALEISDSISRRILCLPVYVSCSNEVEKNLMELMASAEQSLK